MKTLTIALKDTLIRFRDRNAILLMIAAPLIIASIMGAAFGGQSGSSSPISEIPLIIVNADEGSLGANFTEIVTDIEVDTADGPKGLFAVTKAANKDDAIRQVELGEVRGVLYLPPQFTEQLENSAERQTTLIEVYTDPTANVSPGIIRGVVARIANGFSTVMLGNNIAVEQLLDHLTDIPVLLVNADEGPLGQAYLDAFSPENFGGLFVIETLDNLETAREKLNAGDAQAIIHIPSDFSAVVMSGAPGEQIAGAIEILAAPGSLAAPTIESVARQIALAFSADTPSENQLPIVLANLDNLETILLEENANFAETEGARERIRFQTATVGADETYNLLGYFVPSMAIFFLLFTMFDGTRSILEEERDGTLHRLMTTPTAIPQILLGKIGGTFLTGLLQFAVLVLVSALFFDVDWGDSPLGLLLLVLGTVAAATSLGAFVASFARNVNQAGVLGTAITLTFSILGGNFIVVDAFPPWLAFFSKLTINRWSLDGFVSLTFGGLGLTDVLPNIGVLFGIAALFFILAVALFNRRFVK